MMMNMSRTFPSGRNDAAFLLAALTDGAPEDIAAVARVLRVGVDVVREVLKARSTNLVFPSPEVPHFHEH